MNNHWSDRWCNLKYKINNVKKVFKLKYFTINRKNHILNIWKGFSKIATSDQFSIIHYNNINFSISFICTNNSTWPISKCTASISMEEYNCFNIFSKIWMIYNIMGIIKWICYVDINWISKIIDINFDWYSITNLLFFFLPRKIYKSYFG